MFMISGLTRYRISWKRDLQRLFQQIRLLPKTCVRAMTKEPYLDCKMMNEKAID